MKQHNRGFAIALLVAGGILLVGPLLWGGMMGGWMYPGMMGRYAAPVSDDGWWWGASMALSGLMMLAFWALVIVGGILVIRALSGGTHSAEDILRRRYAAGEISREQFEQMRTVLQESP